MVFVVVVVFFLRELFPQQKMADDDGRVIKQEADYTVEVDAALPEVTTLANVRSLVRVCGCGRECVDGWMFIDCD